MIKYPRTPYFGLSPGIDVSDLRKGGYIDTKKLLGKNLVFTVKMDGSNVSLDSNGVKSRGTSATHRSFDMLKARHAEIKDDIPENIQLIGEWMYAKHSIHYTGKLKLPDCLLLFAAYDDEQDMFLGWREVEHMAAQLRIFTVPTIWMYDSPDRAGFFNTKKDSELIETICEIGDFIITIGHEGIVVRNADRFLLDDFKTNIGKYVREGHVQTDKHWSHEKIIRNECV